MAQSNKSSFCIRPFNSLTVATDGSLRPCFCMEKKRTLNIKNTSIEEYWKSEYLKNLRDKFLNDIKPIECTRCWEKEKNNLQSYRLKSNFEYQAVFKNKYEKNLKLIKKNNLDYPEDIELHITNICNLSCQMCNGKHSSRLLIENNYLNFDNLKQKDYDLPDKTKSNLNQIIKHDLKLLNLMGGEPLVNKTILKLIEQLVIMDKAKNMKLHISTNGTTCNDKIINLLSKFPDLRIMLSIESIGKYNNYMRYPSDWKNIEKNIFQFKKLKNAYLYINTVVQNLNLLYLEPLINFAYENQIFLNFSLLDDPAYLEFDNLPLDLLKKSCENLCKIDNKKLTHTQNIKQIINLLEIKIKSYCHNEEKWYQFKNMIKKRDNYRKISIADYMPEIHNVI